MESQFVGGFSVAFLFVCLFLIHARNLYLAMWQEFKIFTYSPNFMYIKKALSSFEFLMLPFLIGINLYSYQQLPKIVILNIF